MQEFIEQNCSILHDNIGRQKTREECLHNFEGKLFPTYNSLSRQATNQEENKDIFRHKRFQTLISPGTFSKTLGATVGNGVYQKRCQMVVMKKQGGNQPDGRSITQETNILAQIVFQLCSEECVLPRSKPRKRNTCEPGSKEMPSQKAKHLPRMEAQAVSESQLLCKGL